MGSFDLLAETNQTNMTINLNFPLSDFRYVVLYQTVGYAEFPNIENSTALNSCVLPVGLFKLAGAIQSRWVDDDPANKGVTNMAFARYISDTQVSIEAKGRTGCAARLYGIR